MTRRGQTVLELVIASGILLTTVTAAITLIVRTTVIGQVSSGKNEALNYAREGIEVIRMIRDSNWLKIDRNVKETDDTLTTWDDSGDTYINVPDAPIPMLGSHVVYFQPNATEGMWWLRRIAAGAPLKIRLIDTGSGKYSTQNMVDGNCTSATGCTTTRYCRSIVISKPNDELPVDYLLVRSTVSWPANATCSAAGFRQSVSLSTRLYDWR